MKEQDAAHSFEHDEQIKKAENEIIRLQSENKEIGKMYANAHAKLRDLQKEFSDTKANLHRAYNGLENYNKTKTELTRLRSELQQERELRKELVNCLEVHQTKWISADHYWGSDTNEWAETLIAKSKAK